MTPDSSDLMSVVIAALEERGWEHAVRAELWRSARVQGPLTAYELLFRADDERALLVMYCCIPMRVPSELRPALAETVARANCGLLLGNFELDFTDGELRFKSSVDVEGGALVPAMVHSMIGTSLATCDQYYPALVQVLYAGASPEAAIAAVETPPPDAGDAGDVADDAGEGAVSPEVDALLRSLGVPPGDADDVLHAEDATAAGGGDAHGEVRAQVVVAARRDQEHFRGCLLGGAVGDALGAPVEFESLAGIRRRYGPAGITELDVAYGRVGAITDDTQMTMFTAEGLLRAKARAEEDAVVDLAAIVRHAYLRWLRTQDPRSPEPPHFAEAPGWLVRRIALHSQRAPGNTCLSALYDARVGTVAEPLNDSKGCGGVMRVAPVALLAARDPFGDAVTIAALTHGHPTGYLAAGALAEMLRRVLQGAPMERAVHDALARLAGERGHEETTAALTAALYAWREGGAPTPERLEQLGKGWVAEEALAMAAYCALAAEDDFAAGVRLAVNHSGDSDSTGAIAGNLLGARLGASAIPPRWLERLELRRDIETLADDLLVGWREGEEWAARYPGV